MRVGLCCGSSRTVVKAGTEHKTQEIGRHMRGTAPEAPFRFFFIFFAVRLRCRATSRAVAIAPPISNSEEQIIHV